MDAYLKSRAELISEDRALRVDAQPRLSKDVYRQAEVIVGRLEGAEADTIWADEHNKVFPGMEFLTGISLFVCVGNAPVLNFA
jgi:hypothetical protein